MNESYRPDHENQGTIFCTAHLQGGWQPAGKQVGQNSPRNTLNRTTYYQGAAANPRILKGDGDAVHLAKEAHFLGHHGNRLAQLLREPELKVVAIDDGAHLNAVGFPGGYNGKEGKICGIITEEDQMLDQVLKELEWEKL